MRKEDTQAFELGMQQNENSWLQTENEETKTENQNTERNYYVNHWYHYIILMF